MPLNVASSKKKEANKMKQLIIGSHVGVSGRDMLLGAVKDTLSYQANAFMFYTGAPQNTLRRPIDAFLVDEAHALMAAYQINKEHVIVHAPYIINLANTTNQKVMELAKEFLSQEVQRVSQLGFRYLVIHPGSHVGEGIHVGTNQILSIVNELFQKDKSDVVLLFETMSGKGSEIGFNLEQVIDLIHGVKEKHRVGLCLDTCHLHDAGYDITDFDNILDLIEAQIGLEKIKAIHVNDSKNERGSKKDRHENLGFGKIGFSALLQVIYNPRIAHVPKILETPWIDDYPPYKEEIAMIRQQIFDPSLKEKIKQVLKKKVNG